MRRIVALVLVCACVLCSCEKVSESPQEIIERVRGKYADSLGAVSLYYSGAEEGQDGYIDEGLIIALLGDGGMPEEMMAVERYAFLCSARISLGEVWAVECYTYTGAREVYALFEKRRKLLCGPDYEDHGDADAAAGTALVREGKRVFFAVNAAGAEIVEYMIGVV